MYSDGYADNMYMSGTYQCLEEDLKDGIMTSLGKAADCLAIKAHWLGKNTEYLSPFNREWHKAMSEGDGFALSRWPSYLGKPLGGKHDDITVTVAQIFKEKDGEDRKGTALSDPHFETSKKIYTGKVPDNRYEQYKRARFNTT